MIQECSETTATLAAGSVMSLAGDRHGVAVDGVRGAVWITQAGDGMDYLVRAGETWHSERDGRVVIQSLTDACVHVHAAGGSPRLVAAPPLAGRASLRH